MKIAIILSILLLFSLSSGFFTFDNPSSFSTEKTKVVSDFIPPGKPAEIIYLWEDNFTRQEKEKIRTWLNTTASAAQKTLGNFPFELHFFIHRADNAREPVPWGNTERSDIQGVNFHVNPDFTLDEFLHDWTAPHEISHLAIPFVGRKNAWFAEGFATYMQGQVLIEMGEFTQKQVKDKYLKKLDNCRDFYQSDSPFVLVADSLRSHHHYPAMYWGGVTFFENINAHLTEKRGMTLNQLLKQYQLCCRLSDDTINELIYSFDKIAGDDYAKNLLDDYQQAPAREVIKE